MKKSKGRKKYLVPVVALCSVGLAVGTGYAAWTITNNQDKTASGTRKADEVKDNSYSIENVAWYKGDGVSEATALGDEVNPTVCFGWGDIDSSITDPWLKNEDTNYKQDRVFTLYFEVKTETGVSVTPKAEFVSSQAKEYTDCLSDNLIVEPTTDAQKLLTVKSATRQTESSYPAYSALVEFKWGTHFDGKNPLAYYNSKNATDKNSESITYVDDAKNRFAELNKLETSNVSFSIKISATLDA